MPFDPSIARRPRPSTRSLQRLDRLARRGVVLASLLATFGPAAEAGPIADWIASRTAPTAMNATNADGTPDKSLISRWLSRDRTPFSSGNSMGDSSVFLGQKGWEKTRSAPDPISEAEFATAKKYFDQGDYKNAEKLLYPLAKREVKKGTPWGEKAQYWLAETQFRLQKYVASNDSFEILIKKYPGTEYVDKLVAREYQIAQIWLAPEDPKAKPMDWTSHFDGRQPLLDTNSYAVKALDHVRLHDPQGPLADDAALRTADHYHTVGDYETAAVYYDQLLAEHPKSEYRERGPALQHRRQDEGVHRPRIRHQWPRAGSRDHPEDHGRVPRPPGDRRRALPHARPDPRPGGRASLHHRPLLRPCQGSPSRPNTSSDWSWPSGPKASGPPRPGKKWRWSPRCHARPASRARS